MSINSRFPSEYLASPARRRRLQTASVDWQETAKYWHGIAVQKGLAERPVRPSKPSPAQRDAIADARAAGFEEVRKAVERQLNAAEPRTPLTLAQGLREAARKLDGAVWDRALGAVRERWHGVTHTETAAADELSRPITAPTSTFREALSTLSADQVDAVWSTAFERARSGGTIRSA